MSQQFTLEEIAKLSGSKLIGDPQMFVSGVADLESADKTKVSFLANRRYLSAMLKSNAGVIFVKEDIPLYDNKNFLIHSDPSFAFQKVIELFHYDKLQKSAFTSIHPTCVVAPSAIISPNVTLGPFVVVEEGAIIGQSSFITSHTYIGPNVHIGSNCYIYSNVTIRENCKIGNRVIIQPGTTIGSCGFGYSTDEKGEHKKLEQIGNVVLEDDVEIGANCAIDRGRFSETRIKKGSKIDNLVQIAHNVEIGPNNLIVSQSGIAGSSKTGRNVVMAGQAALVGHIKIADGTIIAARGAASKSVDQPGGKFAGAPMIPLAEHNKQSVYLRNIEKYVKKIETLEKKLSELELLFLR
jgi:UDP-3-O-[3-hydroxymyristoyl] glucosamine N-acyltransferase